MMILLPATLFFVSVSMVSAHILDEIFLKEMEKEMFSVLRHDVKSDYPPSDDQLQNIEGSGGEDSQEFGTSTIFPQSTTNAPPTSTKLQTTTKKKEEVCTENNECYDDKQCGKGRCLGALLGRCNCRACVPTRSCATDADCGGLRTACEEGKCNCTEALESHGFSLLIDAILHFCDQQSCTKDSDDCHGLPCNVGRCQC